MRTLREKIQSFEEERKPIFGQAYSYHGYSGSWTWNTGVCLRPVELEENATAEFSEHCLLQAEDTDRARSHFENAWKPRQRISCSDMSRVCESISDLCLLTQDPNHLLVCIGSTTVGQLAQIKVLHHPDPNPRYRPDRQPSKPHRQHPARSCLVHPRPWRRSAPFLSLAPPPVL